MARKNIVIEQGEVQDNFLAGENGIDTGMIEEEIGVAVPESGSGDADIDTGMFENPMEVEVTDPDAPFVYLKRNSSMVYMSFMHRLREEDFNLGTTYEDYMENRYVLLTKEQVQFHEDNPQASVLEVLNMELRKEEEPSLDVVKSRKLRELEVYDSSEDVNQFTVNKAVSAWFTAQERANYKNSIDAAKVLKQESLSLFVEGMLLTVSVEQAEVILAMIQRYADGCYMVTKTHEARISALESVEEVEGYDFTVGYPEKLNFDIEV